MKGEFKRAIFKKSNLVLVFIIVSFMFLNTYYNGWNTALKASKASDLLNINDVIFYEKYYGNVYRVWVGSYFTIQAIAPLLLIIPYINTFLSEKVTHFRYLVVSRNGNLKYVINKVLAIAFSGTIILAGSEFLFAVISFFLTSHDTSIEFMKNIVAYKEAFFLNKPLTYFVFIYLSHIIYYFSFIIFSVGITSFLKNKIAVIITPFIVVGLLDMVLPLFLQPNVVMLPFLNNFDLYGYGILVISYIIIGIILIIVSEKIYLYKGI